MERVTRTEMLAAGRLVQLEHTDTWIVCHDPADCRYQPCTVHNRTNHHLRHFPQQWRADRQLMERVCPHGVGHPDPDDINVLGDPAWSVHGCDGCCRVDPQP